MNTVKTITGFAILAIALSISWSVWGSDLSGADGQADMKEVEAVQPPPPCTCWCGVPGTICSKEECERLCAAAEPPPPPTTPTPTQPSEIPSEKPHILPPVPEKDIIPFEEPTPPFFQPPVSSPTDGLIKDLGTMIKTQDEDCKCEKITLEKKQVKANLEQKKVDVEEEKKGRKVKSKKNVNRVRIEIPYKYTVQCEDRENRSILCVAEIRVKGEAEWKSAVFDPINNQFKDTPRAPNNEKTGSTPEGKTPEGKDFPGKPCNGPCNGTPKPGEGSVVYEADFSTDSLPLTGTLKYQIEGSGCRENSTLEITMTVEFKKAPSSLEEDMTKNDELRKKKKSYIMVKTVKKKVEKDDKKGDKDEKKGPSKPPE